VSKVGIGYCSLLLVVVLIFVQYVGGRALVVDCLSLLSMKILNDGAQL
jgi:hypothetical protein